MVHKTHQTLRIALNSYRELYRWYYTITHDAHFIFLLSFAFWNWTVLSLDVKQQKGRTDSVQLRSDWVFRTVRIPTWIFEFLAARNRQKLHSCSSRLSDASPPTLLFHSQPHSSHSKCLSPAKLISSRSKKDWFVCVQMEGGAREGERAEGKDRVESRQIPSGVYQRFTPLLSRADCLKLTMYLLSYNVHTPDCAVYLSNLTYLISTKCLFCLSCLKEVFHFDLYP